MKLMYCLLLFYGISFAQDATSKYNSLLQRYEYFDGRGYLTGYKTYNSLNQSWEYYAVNSQPKYTPQSNVNLPLLERAMGAKQGRYDYNKQRINEVLDNLYAVLANITEDKLYNDALVLKFSNQFVVPVKNKNLDYSSDTTTDSTIGYLKRGAGQIIKDENLD